MTAVGSRVARRPTRARLGRLARPFAAALVAASLVAGTAGCAASVARQPVAPAGVDFDAFAPGDGNGVWLVRDSDLLAQVLGAMRDAGTATMSGSVTELVQPDPETDPVPGRTLTVDYAGRPDAFAATFAGGDAGASVVVDGGTTRIRPNDAYATTLGRAAGAVQCTVGADAAVDAWAPLGSPVDLVTSLLGARELRAARPAALPEGADPTGATVDVAIGSGDAVVGVLTVDRFGPPVPRRLTLADASGDADLVFGGWGEPVDLAARAGELPCP